MFPATPDDQPTHARHRRSPVDGMRIKKNKEQPPTELPAKRAPRGHCPDPHRCRPRFAYLRSGSVRGDPGCRDRILTGGVYGLVAWASPHLRGPRIVNLPRCFLAAGAVCHVLARQQHGNPSHLALAIRIPVMSGLVSCPNEGCLPAPWEALGEPAAHYPGNIPGDQEHLAPGLLRQPAFRFRCPRPCHCRSSSSGRPIRVLAFVGALLLAGALYLLLQRTRSAQRSRSRDQRRRGPARRHRTRG